MNWTEIIGNVASGGILGLLGNAVSFGLNYLKVRQEHKQACERLRLEGELTAAKTAGEVAVAREAGAASAFTESITAESRIRGESRWVTNIRALVRPVLTISLIVLCAALWFSTEDAGIRQFVSTNIVVTSVAAVTWWFGQRQLDRSTITWGNHTAGASVASK